MNFNKQALINNNIQQDLAKHKFTDMGEFLNEISNVHHFFHSSIYRIANMKLKYNTPNM